MKLATDPPVSEAQRRAMFAAAEGRSNLGIPRSVGKEFVGDDADPGNGKHAAGTVFVAPDGDVLLLRRSADEKNYGGHWGLPGGGGNDGEAPEQTARREAVEEMGSGVPEGAVRALNRQKTPTGMVFHTFAQPVDSKFVPTLDGEHSGYCWASLDMLPRPLHPAVADILGANLGAAEDMAPEDWTALRENFAKWTREEESEAEHAIDALPPEIAALVRQHVAAGAAPALAMDWASKVQDALDHLIIRGKVLRAGIAFDRESVRDVDADGRLHVKIANISKAAVNPYLGREIPDYEKLGLEPDRPYKLLRHPDELKKAAPTFNNLPLLSTHEAVSAADHKPDLVVGSLGTDASYEHPFLANSLVVWAKQGIDGIESDEQKEISASYRWRADMTPGEYEGERYDGVMRDIVGNHVALVKKGRAGSDVVVGDSSIEEKVEMAKSKLTRMGTFVTGMLTAAIAPKLAKDAALDLSPVIAKLTAKPLKDQKGAILEALKGSGIKLAKDASFDDVAGMLDKLKKPEGVDELDPNSAPMMTAGEEKDDDEAMDAGAGAAIAEYLKGCIGRPLTEEDIAKVAEMASAPAVDEEDPEAKKKAEEEAKAAKDESEKEEKVDKKAMDAAIKLAVDGAKKSATADAIKLANDIAAAREAVEPWVGSKLTRAVAFDSAEAVYGKALEILGVPTKDIPAAAFKPILAAQPKPGAGQHRTAMAQDAAMIGGGDFAEYFPEAGRFGA